MCQPDSGQSPRGSPDSGSPVVYGPLTHSQVNDGVAFGTTQWFNAYFRRRSRIEGANGLIKDISGAHITPRRIRVRGLAKHALMVCHIIGAYNQGAARAWKTRAHRIAAENIIVPAARRSRKPAQPTPAHGRLLSIRPARN